MDFQNFFALKRYALWNIYIIYKMEEDILERFNYILSAAYNFSTMKLLALSDFENITLLLIRATNKLYAYSFLFYCHREIRR